MLGDALELVAACFCGATTVAIKRRKDLGASPQKTLFYQLAVSAPVLVGVAFLFG